MAGGTRRTVQVLVAVVAVVLGACEDKDDLTGPPPGGQLELAQVSTGALVTCGVAPGSPAYCWGSNQTGALGIGSAGGPTDIRSRPVLVTGGLSFKQVSTSGEHSCGITDDGAAYCWGANERGELGTTATLETCEVVLGPLRSVPCSPSPVLVAGGLTFAAITTNANFTCAVTTTGAGYCWGDNTFGQLGTTSAVESCTVAGATGPCALTPVPVAGGLTFASINTGALSNHVCAVTTGNDAYCWGAAGLGQLGTSAQLDDCIVFGSPEPCARTPVVVAGGNDFASVSAGSNFTCGVTTANAALCWGANDSGQLGNASVTTCPITDAIFPCATTPVAVQGGQSFAQVEAGSVHACGVTTGNQGYCWGSNQNGAVGSTAAAQTCNVDGLSFNCFRAPVQVTGNISFRSIDAGDEFSCGIDTNNQTFCWGLNSSGQLGDGTTINRPTPVRVRAPAPIV